MKTRILLPLLLLSLIWSPLFAQDDSLAATAFQAELRLLTGVYPDSVVLRWAPSTPGAWAYLNKTGYIIERVPVPADSNFDPDAYVQLNNSPVTPLPLEQWEAVVNNSADKSLPAIAAQAVYGDSFSGGAETIYDRADEFMNRYSYSLMAADLSIPTANALGLRWVDTDFEPNATYIYRVYPAVPSEIYAVDTAYSIANTGDIREVPAPIIDRTYGGEQHVVLYWDKVLHEHVFSAYIIERSSDGQNFTRITEQPYINPVSDNIVNESKSFEFTDSVEVNYRKYYYRLRGITALGEVSEPSEVLSEMGRDRTPPAPPVNVNAEPLNLNDVQITWEVPSPEPDLDAFYIGRGDNLDENFMPIHEEKISRDQRSYIDTLFNQLSGNYYVVAAVDTAGNGSISMVSYAAVIDSIPPSQPGGLAGTIDSTGVVTITWEMGQEPDLAGYMVYFSNSADHIFSTINRAPLADTVYSDTIKIKTLTEHIYYRIKAVDTRWNYSEYSEILELKRPDLVPPTTPPFSDFEVTEEGVRLQWIASTSSDVVTYELRRTDSDSVVQRIFFEASDKSEYNYLDKRIEDNAVYTYRVRSLDDDGNPSLFSSAIQVRTLDTGPRDPVTDLRLSQDSDVVRLSWSQPSPEISRYILYRRVNGQSFVTYKSLDAEAVEFEDHPQLKGTRYEYAIKAVYDSGRQSPFSNIVAVTTEPRELNE